MGRIAYIGCYICSREFASRSIASHEKKCLDRWRRINKALPPSKRSSTPVKPEDLKDGDETTWTCPNCCKSMAIEEKDQHRNECTEKNPQEKSRITNKPKSQQNSSYKLTRMIERIKPVVPRIHKHSCIQHNRPNSGVLLYGSKHIRPRTKLLHRPTPNLSHPVIKGDSKENSSLEDGGKNDNGTLQNGSTDAQTQMPNGSGNGHWSGSQGSSPCAQGYSQDGHGHCSGGQGSSPFAQGNSQNGYGHFLNEHGNSQNGYGNSQKGYGNYHDGQGHSQYAQGNLSGSEGLNGGSEKEVSECEERLRTAEFLNGDASQKENFKQENGETSWLIVQAQLSKCPNCNRTFFPERLPIHKRVCKAKPPQGGPPGSVQEKRRPRSVFKLPMGTCYICGRQFRETVVEAHQVECLKLWREANKNLPQELQRPEPKPPELVLKDDGTVDKEAMAEAAWKTYLNQLVPCSRCSRKFLPDRLLAHTHNCKATPLENLHKNKTTKTLKAQESD